MRWFPAEVNRLGQSLSQRAIRSAEQYRQREREYGPGKRLRIGLAREGKAQTREVTAARFPQSQAKSLAWKLLGFSVRAKARAGLEVGSVRRDGPAAHIGLRAGDTILGLAGTQTKTIEEFQRRLVAARFSQTILLSVARGANEYHVTLPLDPG